MAEKNSKIKSIKAIFAGCMVSALEWYDYALYIYFATIIGRQFFPSDNEIMSLLSTFAVFATGFAMRPLGSVFFGFIGDRLGRKKALSLSFMMMIIPTTLLGLLPTYDHIGAWAGFLLVLIRFMQGLAIGGNYGGAYVFSIEHAMPGRRGVAGSSLMFGVILGFLLGSAVSLLMHKICTPNFLNSYGWRIPFVTSCVGWLVLLYLRNHTTETPGFKKALDVNNQDNSPLNSQDIPVKILLTKHFRLFFHSILLILPDVVGIYITFVFMTTYMEKFLNIDYAQVMIINNIGFMLMIPIILFFGWLSDFVGRKIIMMIVSLGYIILSYPLFALLHVPSTFNYFIVQIIFGILLGAYYGALPAAIVEFFPKDIRYTGTALSFNLSAAIFGGTCPWICTWLIQTTNNVYVPAYYLVVMGVLSLIGVLLMKDKSKDWKI